MPIQVIIQSRNDFVNTTLCNDENVEQFVNDYFICINATGSIHSIPHFKLSHFNVLNLYFDDVLVDSKKFYGPTDSEYEYFAKACTIDQAKQMFEFIDMIPDNSRVTMYCTKGKSRSVAVAKFINTHINKIDTDSSQTYNTLVYGLLKKCMTLK
jgi:predicted protein tyrosine phosphatase